ncbi:unnamed protein product [Acanthoscelides obtectus]|uniref:Gag-like protein n=1 Tax=Acanthoscelides obtectus TaxID=200917 RepID=A0A9P0QFV1_ACAOB|nr:unnamed protein product [Acanthoscelides obtectus]CAK1689218.1 hypothetical protein AOBTE_LOCUS37091 [Acanthoscelides obtectus]
MHQALANRDKGITPLNLANLALNPSAMVSSPPELIEKWKSKPLHGRYRTRIEDQAVDTKASQEWICICGRPKHDTTPCDTPMHCVNCEGEHAANSRACPKMKEEIAIQKVRTMEKLSYLEAKKKVIRPIPQKSYSEIAATTTKRKYYAAMPANTTYAQVTASGSDNTTAKKFIQELIPDIAQIIDQQVKKAIDEVIKTSLSIYLPSTSSERRPMRRDQYDLDAASIVSDTPSQLSDKRKRTQYIRTEELVCLTDTSESQLDELSQTKRKKGWPKGVPLRLEDAKEAMKENVLHSWQEEWNLSNKFLKTFKPSIKKWSLPHMTRREQKCPNTEMCTCGQPNHPGEPCNEHKKCINCEGQHAADSRECPRMKEEVAIQRVRTLEKISYLEAKRKVISSSPRVSYAQVTATPSATVNKLVEELLPLLSKTIETQIKQTFDKFVNRPVRTLTPLNLPPPNQYLSDTSTQPSLSEKRKRTVIQKDNADDPADDTDESFSSQASGTSSLAKKKKGWPKGKPRKPPDDKTISSM